MDYQHSGATGNIEINIDKHIRDYSNVDYRTAKLARAVIHELVHKSDFSLDHTAVKSDTFKILRELFAETDGPHKICTVDWDRQEGVYREY